MFYSFLDSLNKNSEYYMDMFNQQPTFKTGGSDGTNTEEGLSKGNSNTYLGNTSTYGGYNQSFGPSIGTAGGLNAESVLGKEIPGEFQNMFYGYDMTDELMERQQFGLEAQGVRTDFMGFNRQTDAAAAKRGFESHGGADYLKNIGTTSFMNNLMGKRLDSRMRIRGFRESYKDKIYDRYMDLLASGSGEFKPAGYTQGQEDRYEGADDYYDDRDQY